MSLQRRRNRTDEEKGAHDAITVDVLDEMLDVDTRVLDTVDVNLVLVLPNQVQTLVLVQRPTVPSCEPAADAERLRRGLVVSRETMGSGVSCEL